MAGHYVDNGRLLKVIIDYKDDVKAAQRPGSNHPEPRIPEFVGECVLKICMRLSGRYNFAGYSFRDEMIGDAVENCIGAVKNFDPEKSRFPFTYFSIVAFNAFVRRIQRESKHSYIKHKNMENQFVVLSDIFGEYNMEFGHNSSGGGEAADDGIRRHYEVIEKFESWLTRRKDPNRVAGGVRRFMGGKRGAKRGPAPAVSAGPDKKPSGRKKRGVRKGQPAGTSGSDRDGVSESAA